MPPSPPSLIFDSLAQPPLCPPRKSQTKPLIQCENSYQHGSFDCAASFVTHKHCSNTHMHTQYTLLHHCYNSQRIFPSSPAKVLNNTYVHTLLLYVGSFFFFSSSERRFTFICWIHTQFFRWKRRKKRSQQNIQTCVKIVSRYQWHGSGYFRGYTVVPLHCRPASSTAVLPQILLLNTQQARWKVSMPTDGAAQVASWKTYVLLKCNGIVSNTRCARH